MSVTDDCIHILKHGIINSKLHDLFKLSEKWLFDRLKDCIFSIIKAKFIGVFSLLLWFSISALVTIVPIFASIQFLKIEMSHDRRKPVNSLPTSDDFCRLLIPLIFKHLHKISFLTWIL